MYNEQLEQLIDAALADGVLTEKEKQVLFKKAQAMGIDLDEFEMVLDARLVKTQNEEKEKAAASAPKSNKFGDVRKCPVCGAIAQAYQAKCPECGYEFSNVDANLSSQKLAELVMNAKTLSDKEQCITLFPIPNTKTDLLEFLTSLQPKMRDVNDALSYAYFKKYQECIAKAKVSFSSDPLLVPFIESFSSEEKNIKKKRKSADFWRWVKKHKIITAIIIFIILNIIFTIIGSIALFSDSNSEKYEQEIITAVNENRLDDARKMIYNYTEYRQGIESAYISLCQAYINNDSLKSAQDLVEHYGDNSEDLLKPIYRYMMNHEMYDEAEKYIPTDYSKPSIFEYYEYMKESVEGMCKTGNIVGAKTFVKRKSIFFADQSEESSEYSQKNVTKKLNSIISTY